MGRDPARSAPDLQTRQLSERRAVQPGRVARADLERWRGPVVGQHRSAGGADPKRADSGVGSAEWHDAGRGSESAVAQVRRVAG